MRAFVSHASEDKDRFVIQFATTLRSNGIDAWLDQWEIRGGDSLVDRIFANGIDEADAFLVVISATSVTKRWVAEELDAAVVRRIQNQTRLVPILLDDVDVPPALLHLKYVDARSRSVDDVVDEVVRALVVGELRPPLGPLPPYASRPASLVADPIDDVVLSTIIDLAMESESVNVSHEALLPSVQNAGISEDALAEAIEVLESDGHFSRIMFLGGGYVLRDISASTWLRAMQARGMDVDGAEDRLLVHIANHDGVAGFESLDRTTMDAMIETLEQRGLIHVLARTMGGGLHVRATAAGARVARAAS